MATTTHDDGFHEIQLNGKQLVFLFMAGTVVAVVIFLLGVFVGRGVEAPAAASAAIVAEDSAASADGLSVPGTVAGTAPSTNKEELTYSDLLGESAPPKETLRREPSATAVPASPQSQPAAAPSTSAAAPAGATQAPAAESKAPEAISVPTEPAGDGFSIQLAALAKRDEAEGIVRRLAGKGYSAYLIAPASGAPSVYRVRVGKFKDRREAEAVSGRLQKEEQFKPWIVR